MVFHVMLIPTLGCPSNCGYCWSSEEDSELMSIETVEEVVKWLEKFRDDSVTITFHGGEPLLAGFDFYHAALPHDKKWFNPSKTCPCTSNQSLESYR